MPIIYNKLQVANQIALAILLIAKCKNKKVWEIEGNLASKLRGNKKQLKARTIQSWKEQSNMPDSIDDDKFFGMLWFFLRELCDEIELTWLIALLDNHSTSVPFFKPPSQNLIRAYLQQARLIDEKPNHDDIEQTIQHLFKRTTSTQEQSTNQLFLEKIVPLDPNVTRKYFENASAIRISGISLYRFVPAFAPELSDTLHRGVPIKILLVDPKGPAIDMAALRSSSRVPVQKQKQYVTNTVDQLIHISQSVPNAKLDIRFINYFPPYGITIYKHKYLEESICRVRPFVFRTSLSRAPVLNAIRKYHEIWFDFFYDQFDKMWEIAYTAETNM